MLDVSVVQVNNEKGEPLTKIVTQARKRFPYEGILENSSGIALSDDDRISDDGAPYFFKIMQDEQLYGEKKVWFKMGETEPQVDISGVRTVAELTELAQTTFETNAAPSLQLVETGLPDL